MDMNWLRATPYDVILWNIEKAEARRVLKGHSNWVVSLAYARDGKLLVSGAGDSTARVWDTETGKEIGRIRFPGSSTYVEGVGLSPSGDRVFALAKGVLVIARVPSAAGKTAN